MNNAVIKIRTENVIEKAKEMSSIHLGMGIINITRTATTARPNTMSPRFKADKTFARMSRVSVLLGSSDMALGVASAIP